MSVLLTILKILGIILLVIVGVILLLLLTALFLPVRYRIHGDYEEDFHLEVKAGWLCRLLYFHFEMDNKAKIGIFRIFGIPIYQFPPDEEKEQRKQKKESRKRNKKENKNTKKKAHQKQRAKRIEQKNLQQQQDAQQQQECQQQQESQQQQPALSEDDKSKNRDKKKKQSEEKTSFFGRIQQFFVRIKQRLIQLPEKLKAVFSKIDDIKMLWMDENNKKSTGLMLLEVKYLLLHYGPTKIHAKVQFSTGDPANTGKVLGILSMIPFLYQKDVHITPDFVSEKLYLQGYLNARGRIRILHLVRTLLHCYKDKNLTTWIKDNL
jgi:hypothetical protein